MADPAPLPRVAGKLASYGCTTVAEVDGHLAALALLTRTETVERRHVVRGDIDLLLARRLEMTSPDP